MLLLLFTCSPLNKSPRTILRNWMYPRPNVFVTWYDSLLTIVATRQRRLSRSSDCLTDSPHLFGNCSWLHFKASLKIMENQLAFWGGNSQCVDEPLRRSSEYYPLDSFGSPHPEEFLRIILSSQEVMSFSESVI